MNFFDIMLMIWSLIFLQMNIVGGDVISMKFLLWINGCIILWKMWLSHIIAWKFNLFELWRQVLQDYLSLQKYQLCQLWLKLFTAFFSSSNTFFPSLESSVMSSIQNLPSILLAMWSIAFASSLSDFLSSLNLYLILTGMPFFNLIQLWD